MRVVFAVQPEEVNFDAMLGERSSLFDSVKLKSKTKPRKSMVPADFQPTASLPTTSIPAPKVGLVAPKASLPVPLVEVESSNTLSDPILGHRVDFDMGPLSLQEELSTSFPPKSPVATPIVQSSALAPGKVTRRRKGKQPVEETLQGEGSELLSAYNGKCLATPFQLPNLQATNGVHVLARRSDHLARVNAHLGYQVEAQKKSLSVKTTLLKGLDSKLTSLKKSTETLSKTAEERAKRIEDLTQELVEDKETAKAWDVERAELFAENDASQACCKELELANVADASKASEALEHAKKEKDAALASVTSARVQFENQKLREFLNSPSYASKIHTNARSILPLSRSFP
ncbi:hypothetical protein LIER_14283 [Lithospermum erythrorhizon]|uniref:Uncharacterized protein n=1 Tax=Lithospermum erythrorhizon TaxID=34254 RepID=A0AAV3PYQ5_LITER